MTPDATPDGPWKCPACGLVNWALASACERCGRETSGGEGWPAQAGPPAAPAGLPPIAQTPAGPSAGGRPAPSQARTFLGLAGSLLLVVGVFAPLISLPIVGSLSYVNNGRGDGVIVLVIGVAALAAAALRRHGALPWLGVASLALILFTFFNFQTRIREMQENMSSSLADNPFRGLGEAMMASVQMQWGWGVLLVGALLLILTPLVRE